jgi:SPOR domain
MNGLERRILQNDILNIFREYFLLNRSPFTVHREPIFMKNWLKNLLFVLFSFIFLGVGMVVAEFFIREKGNPLKDPNFLADTPPDTTVTAHNITADSTNGWEADSVLATQKPLIEPKKEVFTEESKTKSVDYQVIIGIFGEHANADREIKKLKSLGYPDAFSFSKRSMDVVCAGLYDKFEAEKVASDLKNKGFDAIVKHQ